MSSSNILAYLTIIFVAWKALLLLVVWGAPGDGYDTSTYLVSGTNKLVRWDAIYYTHMADSGHVFEQEWAFGIGLSTIISVLSRGDLQSISFTGILVAHVSHYLSVLLLWQITSIVTKQSAWKVDEKSISFTACCLHIVAPAGVFLSAPYSESPFSALNMLGFWLYLLAHSNDGSVKSLTGRCLLLTVSGLSFGGATIVRSNGILSGIPLLLDAVIMGYELLDHGNLQRTPIEQLAFLASTVLAGLLILLGFLLPQALAYQEYCLGQSSQPWCSQTLPLIFSYVQSHYWGVGFLRYWTISNVPLFLLALPTLTMILYSSVASLRQTFSQGLKAEAGQALNIRLLLPQMALACLAITNYHVQIITRLSSGYPWLYIWLAKQMHDGWRYSQASVQFFILYGLIQAALFASFLPPA